MKTTIFLSLLITLLLAFCSPTLADKPSWAGNNKENSSKNNKKDKAHSSSYSKKDNDSINVNFYFNNEQRTTIRNYYLQEYRRGHCPPGLAKKNNGCMPPGQAKNWKKGHPLPSNVVYYDLPSALVAQLGRPPKGSRYIRVANDILLMAVGTGMILDAIQDISSM